MTLNSLKKIIKYRSNYSGTKETDILYKKYFINNLNRFNENELKLLNIGQTIQALKRLIYCIKNILLTI